MSGKFSTTSQQLFNNNNPSQLPDWMSDINIPTKKCEAMDLGINAKGSFAEKQIVYRDEVVGTPRYLEANYNDNKIAMDAKIQLSKFLAGKHYNLDHNVIGNTIAMKVNIASVPGTFDFSYYAENGKLNAERTFIVTTAAGESEYPFSKAGLEECLTDIRSNKIVASVKVATATPSLITLEEIVRRYNGNHRAAIDKARELVEAGEIIGVSSNTYASFNDMDFLFPQLEKEGYQEKLPAFEFAPNTEHVAANPYSSDKVLAIEASKTLAEIFSDFIIQHSCRDQNELLVKADVLTDKGIRETGDFCFGITNDKIASLKFVEFRNERITIDQMLKAMNQQSNILDAYMSNNPTTAKRIYRGIVLSTKDIHQKLQRIANKKTIAAIIDNWSERGFITQVNNTTFTSTASFENLLANVNTKLLTKAELDELEAYQQVFGSGMSTERQDVKDTGIRNDHEIEASDNIRMANLYNELSKHFQNFQIRDFDGKDAIMFFNADTGHQPICKLEVAYAGNQVKQITANRDWNNEYQGNTKCDISKFAAACRNSQVLNNYLEDNPGKKFVAAAVISMSNLRRTLASVIEANEVDAAINFMINERGIVDIGCNMYASKEPISKMLQSLPFHALSKEDRAEFKTAQAYFGHALEREAVIDTGVRDMEITATEEQILNSANGYLAQHFANFRSKGFAIEGDNMSYVVSMFDPNSGLRTDVNFMIEMNGTKVAKCGVAVGNDIISLANVKRVFAQNEVLSKYLKANPGKRTDAPMIMTAAKLQNKLAAITGATLNEINAAIDQWEKIGKVNKIASNAFASRYTIEQLLSMSSIKPLSDKEFKARIARCQREKFAKVSAAYEKDNDTRSMADEWSAEQLMIFAKSELNKSFQQYDIIDTKLTDDRFEVSARATCEGVRSKVTRVWTMNNGKPQELLYNKGIGQGKEVKAFVKLNNPANRVSKGLISRSQLKNKLASVIDLNNFKHATDILVQTGMVQEIDSNTFASKYSVAEIVERLAAFKQTDLDAAKDQQKLAGRDEGEVSIPSKHIMDSNSRALEAAVRSLSPKMIQLRDKICSSVKNAQVGKLITAKKAGLLNTALNSAATEKDLEAVWKDFKKYLG